MKKELLKFGMFMLAIVLMISFILQRSYAKYLERMKEKAELRLASWNIKLNNEYIARKKELTKKIKPYFPATTHTKENIIAPGSIGYYDISIDANDVDKDITYEIDTKPANDSEIKDLRAIRYTIDGITTNITNGKIEGTRTHNTGNKVIRIYIEWYDGNDNKMNNEDDTNLVTRNDKILLSINIKFTQKK